MRSSLALVLALALVSLAVGCGGNPAEDALSDESPAAATGEGVTDMNEHEDVSVGDEPYVMTEGEKAEIKKITDAENAALGKESLLPYDELISMSYPEWGFYEHGIPYQLYIPAASYQITPYGLQEFGYAVECLRRTGDTTAYCMFKTDEGGLVYCFLSKEYSSWLVHHAVYVKNALTKDAFAGIGVGSSLRDVSEVDSTVALREAELMRWKDEGLPEKFFTVHLLRDCLVVIDYSYSDGQFLVAGIRYFDDFKLEFDESFMFGITNGVTYDYTILPQDYPA
jgi:hypothetical protein